jgi:hypothetical protein
LEGTALRWALFIGVGVLISYCNLLIRAEFIPISASFLKLPGNLPVKNLLPKYVLLMKHNILCFEAED